MRAQMFSKMISRALDADRNLIHWSVSKSVGQSLGWLFRRLFGQLTHRQASELDQSPNRSVS